MASHILADLGAECVRIQARKFERLVAGQIRDTTGLENGTDAIEHYLPVLGDKTGVLMLRSPEASAGRPGTGWTRPADPRPAAGRRAEGALQRLCDYVVARISQRARDQAGSSRRYTAT